MWQRCALVVLALVLAPATSWGQANPVRFLPSGSQVYFHWDGQEKHQAAFAKTAIGKTMAGDAGKFLRGLATYLGTQIRNGLAQAIDAELAEAVKDELFGAFDGFLRKGVVLGVELRKMEPLDLQAILVFPGSGAEKKSLNGLLQTLTRLDPTGQVREANIGKHKGRHFQAEKFHLTWFVDQNDLVVTLGTHGPDTVLQNIGKLTTAPSYQQTTGFKEFETCLRGYLDLQAIGKIVSTIDPKVEKITDELGLKAVKGLTFHTGYEGPAIRSVMDLHIAGPRKGILKLAGQQTFSFSDLPPMPPDIRDFSATILDLATLYDVILQGAVIVARLAAPEQKIDVRALVRDYEQRAGVKLREDLFAQFDGLFASYAASAEGILGIGSINLIKVKDGEKVVATLNKLATSVGAIGIPGVALTITKKDYHGVPLHLIDMGPATGGTAPAFTVYKGWLAYSSYPQPVQGFILRARGELPTWQPDGEVQKLLAPFPKNYTGLSISDSRPVIKTVLSVLPLGVAAINAFTQQFLPGTPAFDVSAIPNAYEATRYFFPSVTVTTDDGKRLRSETRSPF